MKLTFCTVNLRNIHDPKFNLDEVIAFKENLTEKTGHPVFIAVQKVWREVSGTGKVLCENNMPKRIAGKTHHVHFAKCLAYDAAADFLKKAKEGHKSLEFGHCLLSPFPFSEVRTLDLGPDSKEYWACVSSRKGVLPAPKACYEPRKAIVAKMNGEGRGLGIESCHLVHNGDCKTPTTMRGKQVAQLLAAAKEMAAEDQTKIIMGCFNVVPDSPTLKKFSDAGYVRVGGGGPS